MRHTTLGVIVITATVMLSAPARADFTGLVAVREFPNQTTIAGPRDVFRVYAEFTNPNDRVDTWYGTEVNPFVIQNVLADGTPGTGFVNFGGSTFPPEIPGTPIDWDTWATIGTTWGNENGTVDYLAHTPSFPQFINGNSLTSSTAGVFLANDFAPQGLASFRVSGQDTILRVLVMQLTVMPGEHVQGMINLGGRVASDSGYMPYVRLSETFNSIPGPGVMWILLMTCARTVSKPRRRLP